MDGAADASRPAGTPRWQLALRSFLRVLVLLLPFAFAGRLNWWRGWLFFASMLLAALVSYAALSRRSPGLLNRRLERPRGAEPFDRYVLAVLMAGFLGLFAVAGLDARFGWSQLGAAWVGPGLALEVLGFVPIYLAVAGNPFLESQVRIQRELGHQVMTTGPYGVVRHPMYAGLLLMLPGGGLILGSAWAFVPIGLLMATFVVRTVLEDQSLRRKLPGYEAYCSRTRHRLVPGVW